MVFKTFLHLLHDRSWDRFWTNFGSILDPKIWLNRPQEGSKINQKSDREICWIWDRFFDDFWSILAPNLGGPRGSSWLVFGVKSAPGATLEPECPPGPTQARFLADLGRFGVDFGSILGRCWSIFGCNCHGWPGLSTASKCLTPSSHRQTWAHNMQDWTILINPDHLRQAGQHS